MERLQRGGLQSWEIFSRFITIATSILMKVTVRAARLYFVINADAVKVLVWGQHSHAQDTECVPV